jgi:hypothetical protein
MDCPTYVPKRELSEERCFGGKYYCAPIDFVWEVKPVPPNLLTDVIERSKKLLQLKDDWDGEGSPAIEPDTWKKAVEFLQKHRTYWDLDHNLPSISPGPKGSIDIHWKRKDLELLLNVRGDDSSLVGYYGDDFHDGIMEGTLNLRKLYPDLFGLITPHIE